MEVYQLVILAVATTASAIIANGVAIGAGIFLLPVLSLAFLAKVALGLGAPLMFVSNVVGIKNYWGSGGSGAHCCASLSPPPWASSWVPA
jgi:uncharacterized membrane protein YfcA